MPNNCSWNCWPSRASAAKSRRSWNSWRPGFVPREWATRRSASTAPDRRSPQGGQIGNLVCKLPGTQPGPRRLLMAHVDTVPLCRGARPVRRGRWIVPADKQHRPGGRRSRRRGRHPGRRPGYPPPRPAPSAAGVSLDDPGGDRPLRGPLRQPGPARQARPGLQFRRRLHRQVDHRRHRRLSHEHPRPRPGQPCRRCCPKQGVSAITIAGLAIAQLHRERLAGQDREGRPPRHQQHRRDPRRRGHQRGDPGRRAARRSPQPRRGIPHARSCGPSQRAFRQAARAVRSSLGGCGKVRFEGHVDYEAFRLADDDPSVLEAEAAVRACGGQPRTRVSNGGLDANWMSARGIPTVTLGCGPAHSRAVHRARSDWICRIWQGLPHCIAIGARGDGRIELRSSRFHITANMESTARKRIGAAQTSRRPSITKEPHGAVRPTATASAVMRGGVENAGKSCESPLTPMSEERR